MNIETDPARIRKDGDDFMRKKTARAMLWIVLLGLVLCYAGFRWSMVPERSILIADAFLPPLKVGESDIFGERPSANGGKTLSEEEFRERYQSEDVNTLFQTGTLDNLREKFGEPLEYSCKGLIFPRHELPAWFRMKYPTGIVFYIENHTIAQVDFSEPGYIYKGEIQVGSALGDIFHSVGAPDDVRDKSNDGWVLSEELYKYDYVPAGSMYINFSAKYYRPINKNILFYCNYDNLKKISIWRPITRPDQPVYPNPASLPGPQWVTFRDTSGSLGYLWSNGNKCRERLKHVIRALPKNTNTSQNDFYPALSPEPGLFSFDAQIIAPEYPDNLAFLDCPAVEKENEIDTPKPPGWKALPDYWYFGYFLANERDGIGFLAAYYDHIVGKKPLDQELPIPKRALGGTKGVLRRLKEGGERYYIYEISDPNEGLHAQALIPILVERPEHHGVPGGHVLYMDGHVQWLPYPGPFPMTPAFIEGVKAVEERLLQKADGP